MHFIKNDYWLRDYHLWEVFIEIEMNFKISFRILTENKFMICGVSESLSTLLQ